MAELVYLRDLGWWENSNPRIRVRRHKRDPDGLAVCSSLIMLDDTSGVEISAANDAPLCKRCFPAVPHPTLAERLERRSRRQNGHLLWVGPVTPAGYGTIKISKRTTAVHRVAYTTWVGPIPAGLEIDHVCRIRNCIEPTHLEPVTRAENLRRARVATAASKATK